LYGDDFFEVGSHKSSNYGGGMDWHAENFWDGLSNYLIENNISFDGIMFDPGSFSWINPNIYDKIISIFEKHLNINGIILLEWYSARGGEIAKRANNFFNLVVGTDDFITAEPGIFRLNDNHSGIVYSIIKRTQGEIKFNTDNIYSMYEDDIFVYETEQKVLKYREGTNNTEETTLKEILVNRFGQDVMKKQKEHVEQNTISCPKCTFSNSDIMVNCEICGNPL